MYKGAMNSKTCPKSKGFPPIMGPSTGRSHEEFGWDRLTQRRQSVRETSKTQTRITQGQCFLQNSQPGDREDCCQEGGLLPGGRTSSQTLSLGETWLGVRLTPCLEGRPSSRDVLPPWVTDW